MKMVFGLLFRPECRKGFHRSHHSLLDPAQGPHWNLIRVFSSLLPTSIVVILCLKLNSIKSSLVYPVFTGVDDSFKHVRPVVSSSILLTLLQLCKVLLTTFVNFFYV
ncbi:hypothetical protein ALT1644_90052 [Alteromonas macleodii]